MRKKMLYSILKRHNGSNTRLQVKSWWRKSKTLHGPCEHWTHLSLYSPLSQAQLSVPCGNCSCPRLRRLSQIWTLVRAQKSHKDIRSFKSWHPPLLHLTVGLTAVVYEACLIAHSVAVDHHATIKIEAVVATVGEVLLHHTAPEKWWKTERNCFHMEIYLLLNWGSQLEFFKEHQSKQTNLNSCSLTTSPRYSMMNCPERSGSLVRMPQPFPSARNRSRHWTHSCLWMCWLSQYSPQGQVLGEHSAKLILETQEISSETATLPSWRHIYPLSIDLCWIT